MISPYLYDFWPFLLLIFSPLETADFLMLLKPTGDSYFLLCSKKQPPRRNTFVTIGKGYIDENLESIVFNTLFKVKTSWPQKWRQTHTYAGIWWCRFLDFPLYILSRKLSPALQLFVPEPSPAKTHCNAHTVLCAVVLTSPVLAMATYNASEPRTCATNVCNANCVVCSGADLPGAGHGHLHCLRAAHLRYQCGRRVDQGILSYHHQEHSRQVYLFKSPEKMIFIFVAQCASLIFFGG